MRASRGSTAKNPSPSSDPRGSPPGSAAETRPSHSPDSAHATALVRIADALEQVGPQHEKSHGLLDRLIKSMAVVAAGSRLFVNLGEAADLLGMDVKTLRLQLNDASKRPHDPACLNFIPKGSGERAIKRIPRSEVDRFASYWWQGHSSGSGSRASKQADDAPGPPVVDGTRSGLAFVDSSATHPAPQAGPRGAREGR